MKLTITAGCERCPKTITITEEVEATQALSALPHGLFAVASRASMRPAAGVLTAMLGELAAHQFDPKICCGDCLDAGIAEAFRKASSTGGTEIKVAVIVGMFGAPQPTQAVAHG